MNPIPSFFKAFILPNSSQRLLLPEALDTHIRRALPEHALLRNHRGKIWPIKIINSRNKWYFTDGWSKFVEDNNIQNNNILVFDFDGNYLFDVKLYSINMCNKKAPESSDEELNLESMEYDESEDEKESDEESEKFTGDDSDDSYKEGEEHGESDEEECYIENRTKANEKMDITLNNHKGKQLVVAKNRFGNKGSSSGESNESKKSTKNSEKKEAESSNAIEDENEVFKHGIIARPTNPHFLTKLRQKRTNELFVPSEVVKDFNLELGEKIMIIDERNREWKAKVKVWKDGRTWLSIGWRAFRKWNNLKWEDWCLCEFVREARPRGLFLKVRILRAGSWLPK